MGIRKLLFVGIGCFCLVLGTAGIFLPILPTTPFYLVTVYCFAGSSRRLDKWFKGTGLYKKHLESYVKKEGMLPSTKAGILTCVSILMGLGFILMLSKGICIPCIIIAAVWIAHVIYFLFFVKTIKS